MINKFNATIQSYKTIRFCKKLVVINSTDVSYLLIIFIIHVCAHEIPSCNWGCQRREHCTFRKTDARSAIDNKVTLIKRGVIEATPHWTFSLVMVSVFVEKNGKWRRRNGTRSRACATCSQEGRRGQGFAVAFFVLCCRSEFWRLYRPVADSLI